MKGTIVMPWHATAAVMATTAALGLGPACVDENASKETGEVLEDAGAPGAVVTVEDATAALDVDELVTLTEYEIPTPGAFPTVIQTGEVDGLLWFTESLGNKIGRMDPRTGTFAEFPLRSGTSGLYGLTAIAHAPDGNLWFTQVQNRAVGRITPAGAITDYPVPNGGEPGGIVVTRDGRHVWFTELADQLTRIDLGTGAFESFPLLSRGASTRFIKVGLDGRVWATEFAVNRIAELDPTTGTMREHEVPTPSSSPRGLAVSPDGYVYFSEYGAGKIGRIDTATRQIVEFTVPWAGSGPFGMHIGPDCNLWFADNRANKIGRMTKDGSFSSLDIPTKGSSSGGPSGRPDGGGGGFEGGVPDAAMPGFDGGLPGGGTSDTSAPAVIAAGPNGTMAFVEQSGNKVGVLRGIRQVPGCVHWRY